MSVTDTAASLRQIAEQSNAWPFEEARKIVTRLKKHPKDEVIFETGYGPSGPAAYWHLRRSCPHDHGAARLSRADR